MNGEMDHVFWIGPDKKEHMLSGEFLTWEDELLRNGEQPQLTEVEIAAYFFWLFHGNPGDLRDMDHKKIFAFGYPPDIHSRMDHVISLWKELRRFTYRYDESIFTVLKGDAPEEESGLYFDIACEVLQPTGIRLREEKERKNCYCIELYRTSSHNIIDEELLDKIGGASKWDKERGKRERKERENIFREKWKFPYWYRMVYHGALLSVLKNGKIMEREFGGGNCICSRNGETTLCSELMLRGNILGMPYELARLCEVIEKTVDLVLDRRVARCEAGWIDENAEGEQLIHQVVLNFCLKNYPYFFA